MTRYRESPIVEAMEIPDEDDVVGWRQLGRWLQVNAIPFKVEIDRSEQLIEQFGIQDIAGKWRRVNVGAHLVLRGEGKVEVYGPAAFALVFTEIVEEV